MQLCLEIGSKSDASRAEKTIYNQFTRDFNNSWDMTKHSNRSPHDCHYFVNVTDTCVSVVREEHNQRWGPGHSTFINRVFEKGDNSKKPNTHTHTFWFVRNKAYSKMVASRLCVLCVCVTVCMCVAVCAYVCVRATVCVTVCVVQSVLFCLFYLFLLLCLSKLII